MTCVIVNDASCLIDLRKGRLLHAMLTLPHRFIVPFPVRVSEVLDFTPQEWRILDDGGLETFDLPPDGVADAFAIKAEHARLSANDCFCLATTERHEEATLLTGDRLLVAVARGRGVDAHGVLWLHDLLVQAAQTPVDLLVSALETWRDDPAVFLPPDEVAIRLRVLGVE